MTAAGDEMRVDLFSTLWSASENKPYDEMRETEIVRARFASLLPFIEEQALFAQKEGRRLRVLDFGCADGHTAEVVLQPWIRGLDYFGSDVYPLEATASRLRARGFSVETSVGGTANLPATWCELDCVLALSCFQYIPDTDETFAALVSRLRPGGLFAGYFYDAAPLRRVVDAHLRHVFGSVDVEEPADRIASLQPLAELLESLRTACDGQEISVREAVPQLGVPEGSMPLQQFLMDYLIFAWAPKGADLHRIQWALAEMLLTGPQVYLGLEEIGRLVEVNGLELGEHVSGPSGHLVIARRA